MAATAAAMDPVEAASSWAACTWWRSAAGVQVLAFVLTGELLQFLMLVTGKTSRPGACYRVAHKLLASCPSYCSMHESCHCCMPGPIRQKQLLELPRSYQVGAPLTAASLACCLCACLDGGAGFSEQRGIAVVRRCCARWAVDGKLPQPWSLLMVFRKQSVTLQILMPMNLHLSALTFARLMCLRAGGCCRPHGVAPAPRWEGQCF